MPEKFADGSVRVGRLTKAHGLKGALKIELYTDVPERRFVPGATFSLQVPEQSPWFDKTLTLVELRWYNGAPVAFFEGVVDRTGAESLARAILWIDEAAAVADVEENAWYDRELVGLRVLRAGIDVGVVESLEHRPAQDLIVVRTDAGEILVPFVEAIVPEVNVAGGYIVVDPPVGLFEPGQADVVPATPSNTGSSQNEAEASRDSAEAGSE